VTAASRKTDPIRKITTKNGETRYRFIIDVGKRPTANVISGASRSARCGRLEPSDPRSWLTDPEGRW
jgi:hypothetical protein